MDCSNENNEEFKNGVIKSTYKDGVLCIEVESDFCTEENTPAEQGSAKVIFKFFKSFNTFRCVFKL